jgi:hypothetical protein
MHPLYINDQATIFLKNEFLDLYNEYLESISLIFTNNQSKNSHSFIKYKNYAIVNINIIYNYHSYIHWLNLNKLPIVCIDVIY